MKQLFADIDDPGLATLDVYREEGLFERVAENAGYFEDALHSLKGTRHLIDIRNIGYMGAVEMEPAPGKPAARGFEAMLKAYDEGVMIRITGDVIAVSPPLICEREHVDRIVDVLGRVIPTLH